MTSKTWSSGVVIDSPWLQDVDTATYTTLPALTTSNAGKLATANNLSELTATASTARSNLGLVIGTNVPSPTGTGASGSWGIGITGNAATATKSTNVAGGNNTTLLGSIPYQSNTDTTSLLSPNTAASIKYLTQTGTGTNGAAPVWSTLTAAAAGVLIAYTRITASGTWTRAAGTTKAFVRVKGGGGGAGGADAVTNFSTSGGGEGEERLFFDASPPSTASITIGAGGSGGNSVPNNGIDGSSSIYVGSITVTATGGKLSAATGSGGLGGSTGSGGSQIIGRPGGGFYNAGGGSQSIGGTGGGGTNALNSASGGANAVANTGYGGSGVSSSIVGNSGGNGAAGFVEIWEYA